MCEYISIDLVKKVIDKEAENIMNLDEQKLNKEKARAEFIKKLTAKNPKDYLKDTVIEIIKEVGKQKGGGTGKNQGGGSSSSSQFVADTVGVAASVLADSGFRKVA